MNKKILVISETPSHPKNDGPRARVHNLLTNLKKQGHEIHFLLNKKEDFFKPNIRAMKKAWDKVYLAPPKYQKIINSLNAKIGKIGIFLNKRLPAIYKFLKFFDIFKKKDKKKWSIVNKSSLIDKGYPNNLDKFIKKIKKKEKFDIVLAEYAFLSKSLKHFNNSVHKVIDTHLAITSKDAHEACNKNTKIAKKEYTFFPKKEEAKALNRADIIIAIQEEEEKFFKKILKKNKKVVTIGNKKLK